MSAKKTQETPNFEQSDDLHLFALDDLLQGLQRIHQERFEA